MGDICKIFGRIGFRGYTTEDLVLSPSDGAISLSPSNIVDGVMDLSKCTYISWAKYEESPEIKIAPNDIVIVKTGNSYGRTAIIRNVEHPMTLNPQFVVLKDIQINPVYLAYFIKTDEFQKQIYGIVGGSAIPTLSQENLANLIVRVPNENIQNTIADILDSLDGKIELNKQINDNLEAMAKQLYDYWFVQFDFPNEEGKPYKSSGGVMVWNEKLKREIPQEWSDCKLKDFINLFDSKRVPLSSKDRGERQGVYPYYGATGIMDYVNDYIFDGDYILLAEDGSTSNAKGFPIVQYIWGKNWVNNHAHIILPKNERYMMFTYQMLRSIPAKQIETGSIQKKISQENLCGYKMVLPNSDLLEKYENVVSPLWEKRKRCIEEFNTLTKQRDELLPLLMNGQASVNYHLSVFYTKR